MGIEVHLIPKDPTGADWQLLESKGAKFVKDYTDKQ